MRDYATQLADTKAEIAAALSFALYDRPRVVEIPASWYPSSPEMKRLDIPLPIELDWNPPPPDEPPQSAVVCLTLQRHLWRKDYRWLYVWHATDKRTGIIYFAAIPTTNRRPMPLEEQAI